MNSSMFMYLFLGINFTALLFTIYIPHITNQLWLGFSNIKDKKFSFGQSFVATNGKVHKKLLNQLKEL